jgi:hypothetical protein
MKNMKRKTMMMLALAGLTAGAAVNAENTTAAATPAATAPKAQTQAATPAVAQKAPEATATKVSADEQAFVAKLNDQSRKAFNEKLSAEQKKSVMVAVKNGANADEAVQKMVAAKDVKDAPSVANAEKAPAAQAK